MLDRFTSSPPEQSTQTPQGGGLSAYQQYVNWFNDPANHAGTPEGYWNAGPSYTGYIGNLAASADAAAARDAAAAHDAQMQALNARPSWTLSDQELQQVTSWRQEHGMYMNENGGWDSPGQNSIFSQVTGKSSPTAYDPQLQAGDEGLVSKIPSTGPSNLTGYYTNPNQTMEEALAAYNAQSPDIDPRWAREIAHAQGYFHGDATFAPGTQWANANTLRSAERQWNKDSQDDGLLATIRNTALDVAPAAILSFAGGPALANAFGGGVTGAAGAGAVTGGLSSAANGGNVLKGMLTGAMGGGIGGYTQGLDQTVGNFGLSQAQLANAVGRGGLAALTGGNPLAATLSSAGGAAAGNLDLGGEGSFLDQALPQLASTGIKMAFAGPSPGPRTISAPTFRPENGAMQSGGLAPLSYSGQRQVNTFSPSNYFDTSRYFG